MGLTAVEHTGIGAFAGLTEICIMQPTVAIKNALQEGRPVPRRPLELYRGLGINCGAMLPITATQFGMHRFLEQTLKKGLGTDRLDAGGKIAVSAGAGAVSALFGAPAELVVIHQQRSGLSVLDTIKGYVQQNGVARLWRGTPMTMVRESLYAAGYLGVAPLLREALEEQPAVRSMPGGPLILSGVTAGLLATVTTHPADTIKTRMQAFPDRATHPEYHSTLSTVRHIVATEGAGTLFAGLLPRTVRIVCAVFILNGTRNTLVEFFERRQAVASV